MPSFPCIPHSWNGITCDSRKRNIVAFQLGGQGTLSLSGVLPTTIGVLSSITTLTSLVITNSPNLKGYIPTQIGSLSSLAELSVQGTSMSGSIPHSLSGLTALTRYAAAPTHTDTHPTYSLCISLHVCVMNLTLSISLYIVFCDVLIV